MNSRIIVLCFMIAALLIVGGIGFSTLEDSGQVKEVYPQLDQVLCGDTYAIRYTPIETTDVIIGVVLTGNEFEKACNG